MKMKVTSLFKLSALLLLLEKPRHGYELIKDIREKFGYSVSTGQVYPFLSSLVKAKFVSFKSSRKRDKKIYALTASGRGFANRVVNDFDELIQLAISKKIRKCVHCGCKVLGAGYAKNIDKKKMYFCCFSCAKSFSVLHCYKPN